MRVKKVFLLTDDIYLFSGIKACLPELMLMDTHTFISDTHLLMLQYQPCLLIIDNRLPLVLVSEWVQRHSPQFINMTAIVLRLSDSKCITRGYESCQSISARVSLDDFMTALQATLLPQENVKLFDSVKLISDFKIVLNEIECLMLHASFTKEQLQSFCEEHSVAMKLIYRLRDKVTARLGFAHFNELIIFLSRNRLLKEGGSISLHRLQNKERGVEDILSDAARLSMAINNDEVVHALKSIVNAAGDVCGVEVFPCWPQGESYAITHHQFMQLAEESGLANNLVSYLMTTVARDFIATGRRSSDDFLVSFNVSSSTLNNPVFYWDCLNFLESTKGLSIVLMVEVRGAQGLNITPAVKELIRSLRNKGVRFALDDFGTGYSSLYYLSNLDFGIIKIKKLFVDDIKTAEQSIPILESVIKLARILELQTIAEGVEHEWQFKWLMKQPVDYMQGGYFSPPDINRR